MPSQRLRKLRRSRFPRQLLPEIAGNVGNHDSDIYICVRATDIRDANFWFVLLFFSERTSTNRICAAAEDEEWTINLWIIRKSKKSPQFLSCRSVNCSYKPGTSHWLRFNAKMWFSLIRGLHRHWLDPLQIEFASLHLYGRAILFNFSIDFLRGQCQCWQTHRLSPVNFITWLDYNGSIIDSNLPVSVFACNAMPPVPASVDGMRSLLCGSAKCCDTNKRLKLRMQFEKWNWIGWAGCALKEPQKLDFT